MDKPQGDMQGPDPKVSAESQLMLFALKAN